MSDDGDHALTAIAFVGSAFSPYYRRAGRRGRGDPENHCALNVALYGPRGKRWAMTERGRAAVERTRTRFRLGPSRLEWDGSTLVMEADEVCVPLPRRLKGRIFVVPDFLQGAEFDLDPAGSHRWRPVAPLSRVVVNFGSPAIRWQGRGYLDTNGGDGPLERDFLDWSWSRATSQRGTSVRYDIRRRDGGRESLALDIGPDGGVSRAAVPAVAGLPPTRIWRMPRESTAGYPLRVVRTLEDTPFYARSIVAEARPGGHVFGVHESLSLRRFANPAVQAMLHFRMPRRRR